MLQALDQASETAGRRQWIQAAGWQARLSIWRSRPAEAEVWIGQVEKRLAALDLPRQEMFKEQTSLHLLKGQYLASIQHLQQAVEMYQQGLAYAYASEETKLIAEVLVGNANIYCASGISRRWASMPGKLLPSMKPAGMPILDPRVPWC